MRFRLSRSLPAGSRPALERGEHILAHAATRDGSYVVATDRALHLPDGIRLPWERVEQAAWRDGWLHVWTTADEPAEHHLRLTAPGSVPETVQERVTATIAVNHQATLSGGGHVRIVGRRPPGGDTVRWTLVFDAGLDPDDPELRAQAGGLLVPPLGASTGAIGRRALLVLARRACLVVRPAQPGNPVADRLGDLAASGAGDLTGLCPDQPGGLLDRRVFREPARRALDLLVALPPGLGAQDIAQGRSCDERGAKLQCAPPVRLGLAIPNQGIASRRGARSARTSPIMR